MNCNTQNAKIASITEKALIAGIDVGSETHFARVFGRWNYEYTKKPLEFSNTEAGFPTFKAWVEGTAEKQGKTVVTPGMEPTEHYWFALRKFLQDSGMKPVHASPHHVKKSRELDDDNPNKNDRKDPKTIAALVNEGRFSYPYTPTGIYAEIRNLSNLRFQTQEELTRIKDRIAGQFTIYFPRYKDVYGDLKIVSGRMVSKVAPLPEDIGKLGVEGVNQIWRSAKLRGTGIKRGKALAPAAEHNVGNKEAPEAVRMELENLLDGIDVYVSRLDELLVNIEEKLKEIPYVGKLMEIKGIGLVTVSGFIAEVEDIGHSDNPKRLQKLAGYVIMVNDPGEHNGESRISYRGRKCLRYVLYEVMIFLVGKSAELKSIHEHYRTRKEDPLKKMQPVVAVVCETPRVFYTMLIKGVNYDPVRLLGDIKRPQLQAAQQTGTKISNALPWLNPTSNTVC